MLSNDDFQTLVARTFHFLVTEYQAYIVNLRISEQASVRFEFVSTWLEITYDPHERTVVTYFGRKYETARHDLHMYLGLVSPSRYYEFGQCVATTREQISGLVLLWANAVQQFAEPIVSNSDRAFASIAIAAETGRGLCLPYYKQDKIKSRFVYPASIT